MPAAPAWTSPPEPVVLAASEVHVWRCDLDGAPRGEEELGRTLGASEQQRAGRLVRARDRRRWMAARGWLRRILARYVGKSPAALEFATNAYGRPHLAGDGAGTVLRFNQTHSRGLSLIAVGCSRDVGVDVEFIRTGVAMLEIATRFFSPVETARLRALDAGDRLRAFFECWTRKEAFVKACGRGLAYPLDAFEVAFGPGAAPEVVRVGADRDASRRWRLENLDPHPDFAGALVAAGRDWRLRCWDAGQ